MENTKDTWQGCHGRLTLPIHAFYTLRKDFLSGANFTREDAHPTASDARNLVGVEHASYNKQASDGLWKPCFTQ